MRIAEIAPPWLTVPPAGYGGIEQVVGILAERLHAGGHRVTLFAPAGSRTQADVVSPLAAAGTTRIDEIWPETHHALVAYLRAAEFDVVHDHTLVGTALATLLGGKPPVVHTLHGVWNRDASRYYPLIDDVVHLVAISESQRRANRHVRYAATIPNGIELDDYPLGDSPREDFLVYIGRSSPDKAPDLALDVAHRAGLPLKMVVKRQTARELEHWDRVVAPLLSDDDEVLDEVTPDEKVDLLRRGRAFVFPIRWEEPFGLVMIEAMACGMPVVATPCGAAAEIVRDGETGFIRGDLDELAATIGRTREISPEACRRRVRERYSAEAMVDGYERLFVQLHEAAA
jgi:glycosyltransferase involved in cell wall biosynthesis